MFYAMKRNRHCDETEPTPPRKPLLILAWRPAPCIHLYTPVFKKHLYGFGGGKSRPPTAFPRVKKRAIGLGPELFNLT